MSGFPVPLTPACQILRDGSLRSHLALSGNCVGIKGEIGDTISRVVGGQLILFTR